ncbi:SIMPL domain-containing protein [Mycobacterium sp. 3519A]|uniref:SIMPL domain-containing protein n=1 Tax=Mycobacterium sp. 3519A TaxID=2057184 RepID=UPI000C7A534D|nr:SIMPL domain-containing protein [Mycobacterium sp. 3519A]
MPTRLLLIAAAALAAVGLSACDSTSGPTGSSDRETRQVTVVGAGEVQGAPDTLNVNASIEFVAPDVSGAMNQTSDRQQAVIDALVGAGIDRKDISTSNVSLQPQFAGGDSTTIVGYRANNSIDIKVRKLDTASQTLASIINTGGDATRINSVNYSLDDDSQLVKDARARAFNDAKDRAQQYAQLSGLHLGKVVSITESGGSTPPTPLPNFKGAEMAAVPVEPGQQTVNFSVTVIFELT